MRPPRPVKAVSSWWGTVVLLLSLCASYLYFTFDDNTYRNWIDFVFYTPAGLVLYFALIVNIISVTARVAYEKLKGQCQSSKEAVDAIKGMDTWIEVPADVPVERVVEWVKKAGFRVNITGDSVSALKGKFSFLPGTVARAGLVVLMTAFLISMHLRKTEDAVLHEGESGLFFGKKISLTAIESSLPEEFLQVGEKSTFGLDNVSAKLSASQKTYSVTAGFPVRIDGLYFRITDIGLYQPLSVKPQGAFDPFTSSVDLDILPPGKSSSVRLPPGELLTFTLKPYKTLEKGLVTGELFNLETPLYHLVLQRGKDKYEGTIRPGETAEFGGDWISLGKNSLYINVLSVNDPALIWIQTGMLITLAGIILMLSRFFWYEKRLCATRVDNAMLIGYREEFYSKWGVLKFRKWAEARLRP